MSHKTSKTILIVDDETEIRETLADLLQMYDYRTLLAKDGEEALSVFAKDPIDLVLSDVRMPVKNGIDLLKEIRLQSKIPVLLMSGYSDIEYKELISLGANDLIRKPFSMDKLLETVNKLLLPKF